MMLPDLRLPSLQELTKEILVADDHAVIRDHISSFIEELIPNAAILEAKDFDSLMDIMHRHRPAMAICDIHMPGCNGYHIIKTIKSLQADMKLIIFTAYSAEIYAGQMLQLGANAFLNKEAESITIKKTILSVWQEENPNANGIETIKEPLPTASASNNPLLRLSSRELEIAGMMVRGLGGIEICQELDIYKTTVSTVKKRVYKKLAISSLPELVAIFQTYSGGTAF